MIFRHTAALGLLLVPVLAACGQESQWSVVLSAVRSEFRDVRHLSTGELSGWLADSFRPQPLLLDARSAAEYQVSHLYGARLLTPDLEKTLPDLSRSQPIVIYCSVGWRSSQAVRRLQALGFEEVYNLEGSIFLWANEGRAIYRQDRQVSVVHPYDRVWQGLLQPELRWREGTP